MGLNKDLAMCLIRFFVDMGGGGERSKARLLCGIDDDDDVRGRAVEMKPPPPPADSKFLFFRRLTMVRLSLCPVPLLVPFAWSPIDDDEDVCRRVMGDREYSGLMPISDPLLLPLSPPPSA